MAGSLSGMIRLLLFSWLFFSTQVAADPLQHCLALFQEDQRAKAVESCLPLAQVGDSSAAFVMARLYAKGVDGLPQWDKVVEWLKLSAANDNDEAAYNLAIAYSTGKGTPVNQSQAVEYYQQSAALGNPKAMRNLASMLERGEYLEQDVKRAFELYKRSAEAGLPDSQLKTGIMLLNGLGVEKDPALARYWFNQSAENGFPEAQLALGALLIDHDPDTAIYWYDQAVANGNPYAAHNLAVWFSEPTNPKQDLFMALAYADVSVHLGISGSQAVYDQILKRIQQGPSLKAEEVVTQELIKEPQRGDSWIANRAAESFVIQLARVKTADDARRFITHMKLQNDAVYVQVPDAEDFVVLYKEEFSSREEAQKKLGQKLADLGVGDAWVRNYHSIK